MQYIMKTLLSIAEKQLLIIDNDRTIGHRRHCRQAMLWIGLLIYSCHSLAQPLPLADDNAQNKRITILHANVGYSPSASQRGESAWQDADYKNSSGVSYSCQIMSYSQKKVIGYGLYFFDFAHSKRHNFSGNSIQGKEKTGVIYIAPQVSYIKRETAFPNCFGLIDFGIGYLRYTSDTQFEQYNAYKTDYSGIGINLSIGYEYAFATHWGARLQVGALYSPIKPSEEALPNSALQPRTKINLFMPSMHLGISYYL